MANLNELMQRFSLYAVGDCLKATVHSIVNKEPKLSLKGGGVGIITVDKNDIYCRLGLKLKVGDSVDAEIFDINDGIPSLLLSANYVFANTPQIGTCKIVGTQGLLVEFDWENNIPGYFEFKGNVPHQDLLEPGKKVECSGVRLESDFYSIKSIRVITPEEEARNLVRLAAQRGAEDFQSSTPYPVYDDGDFEFPKPWKDEEIKRTLGASTMLQSENGIYHVGHCYLAQLNEKPDQVNLDDRQRAKVKNRNGLTPRAGEFILVRITKIYTFGWMDVEFEEIPDKAYVEKFQRAFLKLKKDLRVVTKNGFKFNFRDNNVFKEGMKANSENCVEQFWLGFLYEVSIKNGLPCFENRRLGRLDVKLVDSDINQFSENDTVYAQVVFIEPKEDKAILTVKVLYIVEK